jgi:hypothetical protein
MSTVHTIGCTGCFIAGGINIAYSQLVYVRKVEASETCEIEPEVRAIDSACLPAVLPTVHSGDYHR